MIMNVVYAMKYLMKVSNVQDAPSYVVQNRRIRRSKSESKSESSSEGVDLQCLAESLLKSPELLGNLSLLELLTLAEVTLTLEK